MLGQPCQDRAAGFVYDDIAGVVLCDGAGSCAHSERAAQCLTEWLPEYLKVNFSKLYHTPAEAAAAMARAGQAALSGLGLPPEECWCTMLFYAVSADGSWLCGHIGDGYIFRVYQETTKLLSAPENGRTSSETYFLSEPNAAQHLRIQCGKLPEPHAVLLTSDGGGDTLFDQLLRKPAPAVEQLCGWLASPKNDECTINEALTQIVQGKMASGTEDDVSVAMLYFTPDTPEAGIAL